MALKLGQGLSADPPPSKLIVGGGFTGGSAAAAAAPPPTFAPSHVKPPSPPPAPAILAYHSAFDANERKGGLVARCLVVAPLRENPLCHRPRAEGLGQGRPGGPQCLPALHTDPSDVFFF